MEWMILHTLCAAGMALLGAVIARGWPADAGPRVRGVRKDQQAAPVDDTFARDLAAMLEYTGEEEEQDEA